VKIEVGQVWAGPCAPLEVVWVLARSADGWNWHCWADGRAWLIDLELLTNMKPTCDHWGLIGRNPLEGFLVVMAAKLQVRERARRTEKGMRNA
jgi:hypothetical protein